MIIYNFIGPFSTFLVQEESSGNIVNLGYRTFATGVYFEKVNERMVLKIAFSKKRAWFSGLWNYSKISEYPFEMPIA